MVKLKKGCQVSSWWLFVDNSCGVFSIIVTLCPFSKRMLSVITAGCRPVIGKPKMRHAASALPTCRRATSVDSWRLYRWACSATGVLPSTITMWYSMFSFSASVPALRSSRMRRSLVKSVSCSLWTVGRWRSEKSASRRWTWSSIGSKNIFGGKWVSDFLRRSLDQFVGSFGQWRWKWVANLVVVLVDALNRNWSWWMLHYICEYYVNPLYSRSKSSISSGNWGHASRIAFPAEQHNPGNSLRNRTLSHNGHISVMAPINDGLAISWSLFSHRSEHTKTAKHEQEQANDNDRLSEKLCRLLSAFRLLWERS